MRSRWDDWPLITTYELLADAGEAFAVDATASQVGRRLPFRRPDGVVQDAATVVAVEVVDGGRSVVMTVDVPDPGLGGVDLPWSTG